MKIKKILCLSAIWLLISFAGQSKNIVDYFVDMPLNLIPTLESSYRVELVENYQQSGRDTLQNQFGTTVKLLNLDTVNQNIAVRTTYSSRFEMQVFAHPNDTLIGIINTVCAPICSSYIKFYDTDWNEVKVDFPKFSNDDWVQNTNNKEVKDEIDRIVKVGFVEYSFNPTEKVIEVKNNSTDCLSHEDQQAVQGLLKKEKIKVEYGKINQGKK